jgi:hypothetical protein
MDQRIEWLNNELLGFEICHLPFGRFARMQVEIVATTRGIARSRIDVQSSTRSQAHSFYFNFVSQEMKLRSAAVPCLKSQDAR